MNHAQLIDDYVAGPRRLREAVAGMTEEQIDSAPVPGKWSTRQVILKVSATKRMKGAQHARMGNPNVESFVVPSGDWFEAVFAHEQGADL